MRSTQSLFHLLRVTLGIAFVLVTYACGGSSDDNHATPPQATPPQASASQPTSPFTDGAAVISTFTISATVSGLAPGQQVLLKNNDGNALIVYTNGTVKFSTQVALKGSYSVTVDKQPSGQTCTVANGSGTDITGDVSNISVSCGTQTFSIGGSVFGLLRGQQLTLTNNGGDVLNVSADGHFTFATQVAFNGTYNIIVAAQPKNQICVVNNVSDAGVAANVTAVQVICSLDPFSITVRVESLKINASLTVTNVVTNNSITIVGDGSRYQYIVFSNEIPENGSYALTYRQIDPSASSHMIGNNIKSNMNAYISFNPLNAPPP